jgi:hypothetical protein
VATGRSGGPQIHAIRDENTLKALSEMTIPGVRRYLAHSRPLAGHRRRISGTVTDRDRHGQPHHNRRLPTLVVGGKPGLGGNLQHAPVVQWLPSVLKMSLPIACPARIRAHA